MTHNVSPEGDGLEQRARELLAAEYDRAGFAEVAAHVRNNEFPQSFAPPIRAIVAALASPAVPHAAPNTITAGQREAVARIIAPQEWQWHDQEPERVKINQVMAEKYKAWAAEHVADSLAKADQILTILAIQSPDAVVDEAWKPETAAPEGRELLIWRTADRSPWINGYRAIGRKEDGEWYGPDGDPISAPVLWCELPKRPPDPKLASAIRDGVRS